MPITKTRSCNRKNSAPIGTLSGFGPWRSAFTALLLLLVLGSLSGCRREKPAPTPARGWVRLDTLTALHPNHGMLADLDGRLATLHAQRAQLLDQPALTPAPARVTQATPALPALASPAAVPLAASPTAGVAAQDLAALRTTLTRQHERELFRKQRSLQTTTAADLHRDYARLEAEADARRLTAHTNARQPINAATMRLEVAEQRAKTREDMLHQAERQAEDARRKAETLRLEAGASPKNSTAARQAAAQAAKQAAWSIRADAVTITQRAEYDAAVTTREAQRKTLADATQTLEHALKVINGDLTAARRQAAAASADQLSDGAKQLKARMQQAIDAEVGKEAQRLAKEALQETAPTPTTTVTSPEVPAGTLALETTAVARGVSGAGTAATAARTAALAEIDRAITDVQRARIEAMAAIRRDTRAMAATLAAQHGYQLAIDRANGRNLATPLRRWLREYWTAPQ